MLSITSGKRIKLKCLGKDLNIQMQGKLVQTDCPVLGWSTIDWHCGRRHTRLTFSPQATEFSRSEHPARSGYRSPRPSRTAAHITMKNRKTRHCCTIKHVSSIHRILLTNEWKEVGEEMAIGVCFCKEIWSRLRDYFFGVHHQQATTKSGSAEGNNQLKWYVYNTMLFLIPHITDKKSRSNLSDESGEE
ncbi:hypothetical protein RRG08_010350 [Elysia crispata]|uniref:MADF domain-containing protein n=1 Tax=Elysia crispata TaxID=231223 RepID=A0AAE1E7C3_9GAST|nr:hypothetical protein RRG08_010350 [Elysia crispata]